MTDEEFFAAFADTSLPRFLWTHEAHVRVAFLCLQQMPLADAHGWMRQHIQDYNARFGSRGYHETITQAFLVLIAARVQQAAREDWSRFRASHPELLRGVSLLHTYYSPALLAQEASRAEWVAPDMQPLPTI